MSNKRDIRAYVFKKGLLWIGWSLEVVKDDTPQIYYHNDSPYCEMKSNDTHISHLVFGFRQKNVFDRLTKMIRRDLVV